MNNQNQNDLEKTIAEYQPQLKSFIRRRVDNRDDADDILQDVFYQFVKSVNSALNPIEHAAAWLYRVARNTIINHATKKREVQMPVFQSDESDEQIVSEFSEVLFSNEPPTPETEYLRSLVWTELDSALAELPPKQREIYELTEFDCIPVKEIAQTTGVSVATLLSRKHYAVLHLRKRMKELYDEIIF